MSVDFQQLRQQVTEMGKLAWSREDGRKNINKRAGDLLVSYSHDQENLRGKVSRAAKSDPSLRCALPSDEPLDAAVEPPKAPKNALIIAADGSQINPDRHAEVDFSLINVGAIEMRQSQSDPPTEHIFSTLLTDDSYYTPHGPITEGMLALMRDLSERKVLLDLAKKSPHRPIITFTDGPLELWSRPEQVNVAEYKKNFDEYLRVLQDLSKLGVITAGYVDRPGANHVIRLLEIGLTPDDSLETIRGQVPLTGATDRYIFASNLPPGSRSAVYGLQSPSSQQYDGPQSLHFFYLNIGRQNRPKIARVEIPAWVAKDVQKVGTLHAVLVDQTGILGNKAYPYLLHRAHEAAVVTLNDKEQVTQMIMLELRRRGLSVDEISEKQAIKNLKSRSRYTRP